MSEIRVNTISEKTSANGVNIDSLAIKDGKITNLMNATLSAADLGTGVHIKTADSGASVEASKDELVVEGSANSGISILSGASSQGAIAFGDSGDNDVGRFTYSHSDNSLRTHTNGSEAMRIHASGKVTIGSSTEVKTLAVQQNGGGAAMGIDVHNLGTNAADDALITFETQGHRNYSLGIDRSENSFVIARSDGFGTPYLTIADDAKVGIGTTSPTNKLTVQDGSYKVHLSTQSSDPTIHFTDSSNSTSDGVLKGYKIKFKTDSATTMVLDQNGNLDVKLGNIVMSTAGKGIDFSANTDTGTGESVNDSVLDDYEQGTFTITPTTTGTDFTTSSKGGACFYTKIGDWVYCNVQWFVSTPSGTASSGNFKLTGMPFVCNAGGNSVNGTMASFGRTTLGSPRLGSTYANISDNASEILIYYQTSGGSSTVFEADNLEGNVTPFGAFSIGYPCD